ncbi:MAG: AraC family transcriptional regulator [Vallitalea sp.]|jgi:AraC-like DNA-binding protein/quercetin dioxygenase-like cupin family protein|nr:AraC family transcriptional regulator [Vallitalea sp.]
MTSNIINEKGIMKVLNDEKVFVNEDRNMHFEVHHIEGSRDFSKIKHVHHNLELSLVKSGTGKYYIGDKCYRFSQGDMFIINNIEEHGIELRANEKMENMVIHFVPRFIWGDGDEFNTRYLKIFFDRKKDFSHKLSGNDLIIKNVRDLFFELEEEFNKKLPEYHLMSKVKLLNILVLLLRYSNYNQDDLIVKNHKHETKIIEEIIDFIDLNYHKEIRLKDLADIAHMTPTYFSTFFKKYNGISPTDYLVRKRVSSAMDYLKNTDKTILEISGLCGFNNSANFNKMFKKITGSIPSACR